MFALRERLAASSALRELARRLGPSLSLLPGEEGERGGAASSSLLAAAEDAAALAVSVAACLNLPLLPLRDTVAATLYSKMEEPPAEAARWVGTAAAAARALSERLADAAEGGGGADGFSPSSPSSAASAGALSRVWREALRGLARCVVDGLAAAGDVEGSSGSSSSSSPSSSSARAGAGAERGNGGAAAALSPGSSLSAPSFSPMGRSAMSGDAAALRPVLVAAGAAIERALLLRRGRGGGGDGGGGGAGAPATAGPTAFSASASAAAPASAAAAEACDACFSRPVDGFVRAYYLPFGGLELRGWARGALGLGAAAAAGSGASAGGGGGEGAAGGDDDGDDDDDDEEEEEEEEELSSSPPPSCSIAQVAALLRCVAGAQGFPHAAVEAEMREIITARGGG
jgi:hypothetical protein